MKNFKKNILFLIMIIGTLSANSNYIYAAGSNLKRETTKNAKEADYDFVGFNNTILYSQLTDITNNHKKYLGKTIRYIGNVQVIEAEQDNYYLVNCNDKLACCTAGLEFVLKDESKDISKYPKNGEKVLIKGKLAEYKEGKNTFIHLVDSEVEVLSENA